MLGEMAEIKYLDGDFSVIRSGTHVFCAVTGRVIALENLHYWSVEYQEAYCDAYAALKAHQQRTEKERAEQDG